jgi:XTP/dITP diphosphohydrolase
MRKVRDALAERKVWEMQPGPRANFTAALCLAWPDGESRIFEGKVFGHLVWPPRGNQGFGYDPMFLADGETQTFGEMDPPAKHAISHRARAFRLFVEASLG